MLIDLQVHSNYSDGYFTPTQLAAFLASQGVKIAALTDHNTVGGLTEFRRACRRHKIKPITGVELYVKIKNQKINLLWYNFDETNPELHKLLRSSQIRRRAKARQILKILVRRGFKINVNKTLDKYNHYIALNYLARDLWSVAANRLKIKHELKNQHPREEEIIHEYLHNPEAAKLSNSYIGLERIIKLRRKIGGQLIFNHPGKRNQFKKELLEKLKKIGVDGLEVLSPHHSVGAVMYAQFIAKELGFIMSGGSDFHRLENGHAAIKKSWQYYKIDSKYLKGIKKIIG